ncbi:MAG: stage II sporulation protein M, partial [Rhizobiaceae bacterium]
MAISTQTETRELIRSARFRKEREMEWKRLAILLGKVESKGVGNLTFDEASQLSALYRQSMNSLSLAREISLDSALLDYLQSLNTRAYLAVYAPRDRVVDVLKRFFVASAPQAVRRSWFAILLTFLFMGFGALAAYWLTIQDPDWYYSFVGRGLSNGRGPGASEEMLRRVLYPASSAELDRLAAFSTKLFTHNTQVSIFAFALGIMAGLPTAFLMFYNGTILGTFFAIHQAKGLGWDLFGWLSIHGVTEITAILLAGAGGLRLASAILFPGKFSRSQALRDAGRDAVKLAILAALMLVVAGLLEGFGRQLITDFWARVSIG